jgi:hypothetical protein
MAAPAGASAPVAPANAWGPPGAALSVPFGLGAPPPEITPGRWVLRPDMANMGAEAQFLQSIGGNAAMTVTLDPSGQFTGDFEMAFLGMNAPASLSGVWRYDQNTKVLMLNALVQMKPMNLGGLLGMRMPMQPPQAVTQAWLINSGSQGRYQAFETSQGKPWIVARA